LPVSIVTGGAGFIGSNLVEKLVKLKHKVIVIDNLSTGRLSNIKIVKKKIIFKKIDLYKNKNKLVTLFKEFKVDYIFHLAGLADIVPSIVNPENYFNSNVVGTLNILEVAKNYKIKKLIYAASASCYGIPKRFPTSEKDKIETHYPYATSKFIGELVLDWAKIYKMNNLSLRFFNVYGPRSRTSGAYGAVFGVFLAQKLSNNPLTIVGDGNQTRDFIHVHDLVSAILSAAKNGKCGQVYNLGSGKETTINYIAKLISDKKVHISKRPGEPDRSKAKILKACKDLKWKPKISVKKGIKLMLENIDLYKDSPVWTPSKIKKATKIWFKFLK
jgi:UDP-glucose 4-epimerase